MAKREKPLLLLVDDNPQNLQVLAGSLEEQGYEIALATRGKTAIEFAQNELPDLILLDVMMPEMDGYETCRVLKSSEKTKNIPVIFLTARTETEDVVTGFDAGGIDYINKPFRKAELVARVHTHVELKLARDEIKTLRSFLPICANCKSIRNEVGAWESVESYICSHTDTSFSHGICPECLAKLYPDIWEKMKNDFTQ